MTTDHKFLIGNDGTFVLKNLKETVGFQSMKIEEWILKISETTKECIRHG